jgi:NitT/TauT family transport system permease protein
MNLMVRYLPVVLLLALWEVASRLALISPDLLPALNEVIVKWWVLFSGGDLIAHALFSLMRAASGLAMATVVGISLGILIAKSPWTERFVQPILTFLYPLPKSALIPVIMIWLGFGHSAQITVIFLGCLLPIVLSSYNGARGVERTMIWSAQSLGAGPGDMLRQVIFRAALPEILSGIRISLALSFVLLISAEMVGARKGMGFLIAFLGDSGEYTGMFAVAFTVIAFGFAADRAYLWLMIHLLRYRDT